MNTTQGRTEWYQIGHTAQTLGRKHYASWDEAERIAILEGGKSVWRCDYHGVVCEMPSPRNQEAE